MTKQPAPLAQLLLSTAYGQVLEREHHAIQITVATRLLSTIHSTIGLLSPIFRGLTFKTVLTTSASRFQKRVIRSVEVGGGMRSGQTTQPIRGFRIIPRWASGRTVST